MTELHFYDPQQPVAVLERRLPHWAQAGVVCFITCRTNDSMPADVLERWRSERRQWLVRHRISPQSPDWKARLQALPQSDRDAFHRHFSERWHAELDAGHGTCVLRHPEFSKAVADSLLNFDGDRYEMYDFVVMPNHVHLLVAFPDEDAMLTQCDSWKHFTARHINRKRGTSGRFWQQDGFDHLVRSVEQFEHFRRYIADNPGKAGLRPDEYVHYSKPM